MAVSKFIHGVKALTIENKTYSFYSSGAAFVTSYKILKRGMRATWFEMQVYIKMLVNTIHTFNILHNKPQNR